MLLLGKQNEMLELQNGRMKLGVYLGMYIWVDYDTHAVC